jgi:(p)ppGpp synthase/HD superfamily hydrolase
MDVASIVAAIRYQLYNKNLSTSNTTGMLQLLLQAAIEDVRVVVVKLALHTCRMRQAEALTEQVQRDLAKASQDIYIPLSNILGIGQIKSELENLSFRFLEPVAYNNIVKLLDAKQIGKEEYLQEVISVLSTTFAEQNITAEISWRVKHTYSIWKKMRNKAVDYDEIYDVQAVRVLVNDIADCYAVLGVIHTLWSHIPKEFDDYIANPKGNGYQSLHTAVVGPDGKIVEIQIRTKTMHILAELGIAAHWKYKECTRTDLDAKAKLANLRQLINWQKELDLLAGIDNGEFKNKYLLNNAEIVIQDVGGLMCHMAKCCKPVSGEEIIGYITLSDGVSIHRKDCLNVLHIKETKKNRLIQVAWGAEKANAYAVNIIIKAYQRQGLLRDITAVLVQEQVDIKFINTQPETQEHLVDFKLRIEVTGVEMLTCTLAKLHQINNVYDVYRDNA